MRIRDIAIVLTISISALLVLSGSAFYLAIVGVNLVHSPQEWVRPLDDIPINRIVGAVEEDNGDLVIASGEWDPDYEYATIVRMSNSSEVRWQRRHQLPYYESEIKGMFKLQNRYVFVVITDRYSSSNSIILYSLDESGFNFSEHSLNITLNIMNHGSHNPICTPCSTGGAILLCTIYDTPSETVQIVLFRISENMSIRWNSTLTALSYCEGRDIIECNDGGFLVAGVTRVDPTNHNTEQLLLVQFDSMGNYEWNYNYTTQGQTLEYFWHLGLHHDGDYFLAGGISQTSVVFHIHDNGTILASQSYPDFIGDGIMGFASNDYGALLVGTGRRINPNTDDLLLCLRIDNSLNTVWNWYAGGYSRYAPWSVLSSRFTGFYVMGTPSYKSLCIRLPVFPTSIPHFFVHVQLGYLLVMSLFLLLTIVFVSWSGPFQGQRLSFSEDAPRKILAYSIPIYLFIIGWWFVTAISSNPVITFVDMIPYTSYWTLAFVQRLFASPMGVQIEILGAITSVFLQAGLSWYDFQRSFGHQTLRQKRPLVFQTIVFLFILILGIALWFIGWGLNPGSGFSFAIITFLLGIGIVGLLPTYWFMRVWEKHYRCRLITRHGVTHAVDSSEIEQLAQSIDST